MFGKGNSLQVNVHLKEYKTEYAFNHVVHCTEENCNYHKTSLPNTQNWTKMTKRAREAQVNHPNFFFFVLQKEGKGKSKGRKRQRQNREPLSTGITAFWEYEQWCVVISNNYNHMPLAQHPCKADLTKSLACSTWTAYFTEHQASSSSWLQCTWACNSCSLGPSGIQSCLQYVDPYSIL